MSTASSRPLARAAAGLPQLRDAWSKDRIINELRARARRGEYRLDRNLKAACERYFGSARAARGVAGALPPAQWSKARIVQMLRERAARGELSIDGPLADACSRYFGSRIAARKAAGIPAAPGHIGMSQWSRERVLDELRRRIRIGTAINGAMARACQRCFGSLTAAREAAGPQAWSKAHVIRALQAIRNRRSVRVGPDLAQACRHHFGSVAAAREETARALVPRPASKPRRRWSRESVLQALRVWSRNRRGAIPPTLYSACKSYFGSTKVACAAAGVPPLVRRWSMERLKQELRKAARAGGRLSPSLALACHRYFGSITAARKAAGVPLLRRKWSKESVIAELKERDRRGIHRN